MGSGASTSISPSTSRHDSIVDRPKIKLKSSPKRNSNSQTNALKMMRRPSVFDEVGGTEDDEDVNPMHAQNFDGDDMEPVTKDILVHAVEAFLIVNGTDLRDNVIEIVIKTMSPMLLQRGEAVITQGEIGTSVYIVESGNLQVTVNNERIRKLGPGVLFGELALLFDARRSATVTCLDTCKLWSLSRTAFKIIQRNATNLAIMQRTRRFRAVPELACISSTSLTKLMATLTPMSYKSGDALYAAGKCTTKVMLIEEGSVTITVPLGMQHLPLPEIDRMIGVIRPVSVVHQNSRRHLSAAQILQNEESNRVVEIGEGENAPLILSFQITEGCVIGMGILLGKIGSPRGWPWVDAKVDGKPYVGAMPPITAIAVGTVKTAFFTVCRFERIFGSTDDFYDSFLDGKIASEHVEVGRISGTHRNDERANEIPFVSEVKYHLEYFTNIQPYQTTHMGYFATAVRKEINSVGTGQNKDTKYILRRLSKSLVCKRNNVKSVLDEAKILESVNSFFITSMLGRFQTTDELVFVYDGSPIGDLWNVLHEDEELRDQNGFLSLDITRFYAANIILALEHLHERKIAYRNLKPENILVDANGYIKLSCMSFAKVIPFMTPQGDLRVTSFTFCGTLEYLAPEMVLNCGHDQGVDKWALGVLLYEMLTGFTPFDPVIRSNNSNISLDGTTDSIEASKASKIKLSGGSSEQKAILNPVQGGETVSALSDTRPARSRAQSLASAAASTPTLSRRSDDDYEEVERQAPSLDMDPLLSEATSRGSMRGDWNSRADWENDDVEKESATDRSAKILATLAGLKTTVVDLPHDFNELQSGAAVTSLILLLLNYDPLDRPEMRKDVVNSIFQHDFFDHFNWPSLSSRAMKAPHVPTKGYLENSQAKFSRRSFGDEYGGDDTLFSGF